jgi:hypothetical protein
LAAATGALAGDTRLVRQLSDNAVFQISTIVSFEESAGQRGCPGWRGRLRRSAGPGPTLAPAVPITLRPAIGSIASRQLTTDGRPRRRIGKLAVWGPIARKSVPKVS